MSCYIMLRLVSSG